MTTDTQTKPKSTWRRKITGLAAAGALAVATFGGAQGAALATAEPAAAWTLKITKVNPTEYYQYGHTHKAKSPWCLATGNCHATKIAVWGKNAAYPKGRWFYHTDIH